MNQEPDAVHWLGTDHLGRDVLARLAAGARLTLLTGVGGALIAFGLGAGLGLVALALGDPLRSLVLGFFDLLRALPGILVAILLVAALSPGPGAVMLALGLTFAPMVAEVVRGSFARETAADYVAAARVFGLSRLAVTWRHILPNIAGTLLTMAAIILPRCIVTESVLSFLGLGGAPDIPSWGRMIADAAEFAEEAPHAVAVPVLALSLFTLSLSLVGARIRSLADPLQRAGGAR
ncbi:ABC transporter permease [Roseomonas eburnea]|uniref:ABC transporter permease n=1 Tax=Neoroseomonas eburnea TaxID=1346889 RepID=A0A9X9XE52_9PROT|nr:ABC transporter permease [Neoroseomonas eburnea]